EPLSDAQQRELAGLDSVMNRELARGSAAGGGRARPDQIRRLAEDERRLMQAAGVNPADKARIEQVRRDAQILALSYEIADLKGELPPGAALQAGTPIKVPQYNWPSLVIFGGLALLLAMVGMGWVLQSH